MTSILSDHPKQTAHWFAGANTRYGFIGLYDSIFQAEQFDSVYVIQGAPGTGKSHFMKAVAAEFPEASQERLYCSSDPSSLDGLILRRKGRAIGILDGTSPHSRALTLPGAVETVLDLGAFWNRQKLRDARSAILTHTRQKKAAYENAYAILSLSGHIETEKMRLLQSAFLREKAEAFSTRLFKKLSLPKGKQQVRYLSAIGMTGQTSLAHRLTLCKSVWRIPTYYGTEKLCLDVIAKQAKELGVSHVRFPDVLDPYHTECLLFPEAECAILAGEESTPLEERAVTPTRFVSSDALRAIRPRLRALTRMLREEKEAALSELAQAGREHFALEGIFAEAMDFEAKEIFTSEITESIRKEIFFA